MRDVLSAVDAHPDITISNDYYYRALGLIPSVTQTLAKGPSQHVNGFAPKFLRRGRGSRVWDVDGNEFIDYTMGVGPISLGYCYERVDEAIRKQLEDGITFSLMHPLEVEVAELVRDVIPNAEAVRFSKSGADVTSAAVRLARAYTGREKVLCCGYHGWHDWYIGITSRNAGVPESVRAMTYTFEYNDIEALEQSLDSEVACVILEPTVFEEPQDDFLHRLRELCSAHGIILIFDEMWTGFRMALGGAQEYFGVEPDLACYSKAVANGMPLSIITGKGDIMERLDKEVFFYTTFGGEALSLAAAKATILEMKQKNVTAALWEMGKRLKDGYNAIASEYGMDYTKCSGYDCRTIVTFDPTGGSPLELKSLVQQEMIRRGILWSGMHVVSYSHTKEDIDYTLGVYEDVLRILRNAVNEGSAPNQLDGAPVEPVFRKVTDFNIKPRVSADRL